MAELILQGRSSLGEGELPLWARRALRRTLPAGTRTLNGSILRSSAWGGTVLVNTTRGAALVTKSTMGRARIRFLAMPCAGPIRCPVCHTDIVFGGRTRETFYCTDCGTRLRRSDAGILPRTGASPANRRYKRREVLAGPPAHGPVLHGQEPQLYDTYADAGAGEEDVEEPEEFEFEEAPQQTVPSRSLSIRRGIAPRRKRSTTPRRSRAVPVPTRTRRTGTTRRQTKGTRRVSAPRPRAPKQPKVQASEYEPQCQAITPEGRQCRNSSRHNSKYCASHRNYTAPPLSQVVGAVDTEPRYSGAPDTKPAYSRARASSSSDGNGRAITTES